MEWEEIRRKREEKKLTQVEVSRAVGVSLAGFRLWESGAGNPNKDNLKKLEAVLNCDEVA